MGCRAVVFLWNNMTSSSRVNHLKENPAQQHNVALSGGFFFLPNTAKYSQSQKDFR